MIKLLFLTLVIIISNYLMWYVRFRKSTYTKETGHTYFETIILRNLGLVGEFDTYRLLEKLDGNKKILANIYIPTINNETTEIDLVLIHQTGIYIIESKNYSGYIYGSEKNKNWVQYLNHNTKNYFFNPIWQNKKHIKYLSEFLGFNTNLYSVIVFSKRCNLRKIKYNRQETNILKRDDLLYFLKTTISKKNKVYSEEEIEMIYQKLKPLSNQSTEIKERHISTLKDKHNL